ncbi:SDR family oxidoreductase [Ideonella livida]|uniref:SDR family oxidoreductase n=1 Tax=Ideonella livida TaxID=2707176 RepID=A0A7C9TLS2_9BURK|nr:SDR family oxidoreductase [Ideonella livida]NDY92684.1 SDR family oxidoreductase [Ideonella livida]
MDEHLNPATATAPWAPRSALVLGASRGIGLALVRQYREAGLAVTATARDEAGLARLQALGARALKLDVTQTTSAAGLAWQLDGEAFDAVWFAAGVYGPNTRGLQAPTAADFDAVMRTNVLGAMLVMPQLVDALAPGARVALLSSRMGSIGARTHSGGWLYRASKAALNSVLADLALAWQGRALCVAVHPGWVRTDMGGPEADLEVDHSAADLRALLAGLVPDAHGGFFDHSGARLPW